MAELEALIKQHYAALCATALHFVGSPDVAQDITQEVLIKFWENRETYKEVESLDHFLFIMVRNEALNHLRSVEREKQRHAQLEFEETEEPNVLNLLVEEEINQILTHAINQLPQQMARIMRLVLSEYENKEIAEIMGVSINTIKTLKYAAIRKLKVYFEQRNYRIE